MLHGLVVSSSVTHEVIVELIVILETGVISRQCLCVRLYHSSRHHSQDGHEITGVKGILQPHHKEEEIETDNAHAHDDAHGDRHYIVPVRQPRPAHCHSRSYENHEKEPKEVYEQAVPLHDKVETKPRQY